MFSKEVLCLCLVFCRFSPACLLGSRQTQDVLFFCPGSGFIKHPQVKIILSIACYKKGFIKKQYIECLFQV